MRKSVYYEGQDLEALANIPRYQNWIMSGFRRHLKGRVIEVGAGTGNISARYVSDVEEAVLLEPAQNLFDKLKRRFRGKPHVHPVLALLEDLSEERFAEKYGANPGSFDVALMVNVLEHIEDDALTLSYLFDLLRPGGALLLFVPALPWLYGTLDVLVHHVRRYSLDEMAKLVSERGFTIQKLCYFDWLGVIPWFITGRILRQRRFSERGAKVYDRLGVPIASFVEGLIEPPFGKNLMCIAHKPNPRSDAPL